MTGNNKNLFSYTRNQTHEVYWTGEYKYIESIGGVKRQINPLYDDEVNLNSDISELCITIDNIIPNFVENSVSFDVKVKANQTGYKLSELYLGFEYPKENLGEFIVQNVKIEVTKGPVVTDEIYGISKFDIGNEKAGISITTDCMLPQSFQLNEYYTLSTSFEKLITVKLLVENWGGLGDLTIENFVFDGTAKHIAQENNCADFDLLCVDRGEFQLVPCSLTSFTTSPFGAGVQQVMEINGSGFGSGGMLEIPNADDGGASKLTILSTDTRWAKLWTDSKIEILVSSSAPGDHPMGSGEWIVTPLINMSCMDDVDIEYAISNTFINSEERMSSIAHSPFAGNQSFEWYIDHNAISTNANLISQGITLNDIETVCRQAFCDWEVATNIQFEYMGDNPNGNLATDQKYTITVGPLSGNIRANTPTRTSQATNCENTDPFIDGRLFDADIIFDENTNWFVSTSLSGIVLNEHDFYSVISHEIGHILLLKHSCDIPLNGTVDNRIMYFQLNSSDQKRMIDQKSLNGIDIQKTRTISANMDCQSGFDLNTSISGCVTSTRNTVEDAISLIFTNPISRNEFLKVESDHIIKEISILDIYGRIIFSEYGVNNNLYRCPIRLNTGTYIIVINDLVSRKLVVI